MAKPLLSFNNYKTVKGEVKGYRTAIMYLAPHNASGVINTCEHSTPQCRALCLYVSGMSAVYKNINNARIRKTKLMFNEPNKFWTQISDEIDKLRRYCFRSGMKPAVRLNGTSDLWNKDIECLMHKHKDIQFYDYTKDFKRIVQFASRLLPANYHLTYSHAEGKLSESMWCLKQGVNVAVVFKVKRLHKLPEWWNDFEVIDGDIDDLRFLNKPSYTEGKVIGLRTKGKANQSKKVIQNGFINPNVVIEA